MSEIFVISGFSGVGKSLLCEEVLKNLKNTELVKSYTTRMARKPEEKYTFVSSDKFMQMKKDGEFLETNTYNQNQYGTPKREVEKLLKENKNIVLEIDVQGYKQLLSSDLCNRVNVQGVFIVANAVEIFNRLKDRNTEKMEKILERLETAIDEAKEIGIYDVIIENSDFKVAHEKLENFLSGREIENKVFDIEKFVKDVESIIQQHSVEDLIS